MDSVVTTSSNVLSNSYVTGALVVVLVLYASQYAPTLPSYVSNLFDSNVAKLILLLLLVVVVGKQSFGVGLVVALAFLFVVFLLKKYNLSNEFMADVEHKDELKTVKYVENPTNDDDHVISIHTSEHPLVVVPHNSIDQVPQMVVPAVHDDEPSHIVMKSDEGKKQQHEIKSQVKMGLITKEGGKLMEEHTAYKENVVIHKIVDKIGLSEETKPVVHDYVNRVMNHVKSVTSPSDTSDLINQKVTFVCNRVLSESNKGVAPYDNVTEHYSF